MEKDLLEALFKEQSQGIRERVEKQSGKDKSPLKLRAPEINEAAASPLFSRQWTYTRFMETQYGDIYHAVLARIKTVSEHLLEDLHGICSELCVMQDIPCPVENILKTLTDFLSAAPVSVFFKHRPGEEVFNEKEFADGKGNLFRMDKVIVAPAEVVVVDFKSGTESGDYNAQIMNYVQILGEIYPGRTIKGFLAYIKEAEVKQIA